MHEILGWLGTFLIVLAYFLVTTKKISPTLGKYQLMNLLGSLGVMVNVFVQQAIPALALEIVWSLIAIYGLVKVFQNKS